MSLSFPKVKGFKKDKRSLIESTNNLVVFGEAQTPQEVTGIKGRRLLRRGGLRQRRSSRPKSIFPPGACSTTQKLDKLVQRIDLTNYFSNTKPWNNPAYKKSSFDQQQLQNDPIDNGGEFVSSAGAVGGEGFLEDVGLSSSQLPPQRASVIVSSNGSHVDTKKSPSMTFVNSIVCPVCLKGFEPLNYNNVLVSDLMTHSLAAYSQQNGMVFKKTLEDGWGASAKPKCVVEPQDVVVAGNCGELFHRLCLRDWCSRGHRKSPRSSKPVANCPSCDKELKYTMCQEIEILRCFSREHTMLHKEFIKVKHVNKELQVLWPETNNYLIKIRREIQDTETLYNELRSKRRNVKAELKKLTTDDLSIVMAKVTDVDTLKSSLGKQEKALAFMQQETLQIMRMYLLTIIRKLKDCTLPVPPSGDYTSVPEFASLIGRVPPPLVPYLQDIVNDNQALASLSRILVPYRDDLWDETQQKYLELELIQKFSTPKSPPNMTRPHTYVVSSSAPEVGDSDSDDVMVRKMHSSSSDEEKAVLAASSLKTSTATHKIFTIPSSSKPQHLLYAGTLSNLSVIYKEKPRKLIKVLEIDDSTSTINSSLLDNRLKGINFSPNGGGSVDKTYVGGLASPSISSPSPSSAHQILEAETCSLLSMSKTDVRSSSNSCLNVDPTLSLHHYEQDSKYVRAIRQLMTHASNKVNAQSTALHYQGISSVTSKLSQEDEVLKIHTGFAAKDGSGQPSSTNSETNQLNHMLIDFMRRQQKLHGELTLSGNLIDNNNENIHRAEYATPAVMRETPTPASALMPPPPHNSENDSKGSVVVCKANSVRTEGTQESSWSTISPDTESKFSSSQSTSPLPERQSISLPTGGSNGNTLKPLDSNDSSCEPVYTDGYMTSSPLGVVQSENKSSADANSPPSGQKDEEVSIAIMYVIEDEDENEVEFEDDNPEDEKVEECSDEEIESTDKALLPLPLPHKVLSPIYLTAEKTSNYSIIANQSRSTTSNNDLFAPIMWPRPSRMIPSDTPSNVKLNCSSQDIHSFCNKRTTNSYKYFENKFRGKHKYSNSLTSLPLPPLPEEMDKYDQRMSDSVVPTVYYENETGTTNCSSNKKILVN